MTDTAQACGNCKFLYGPDANVHYWCQHAAPICIGWISLTDYCHLHQRRGLPNMDTQIATAQRWAEACELLFSLTSTHWMADDKHNCAGDIQKLLEYRQQARREALEEAAKAMCMYCNDAPRWAPMSNSGYHQCSEPGPNMTRCRAIPIHQQLDRLREGQ